MSPSHDLRIEPTAASPGTAPMHAARQDAAPALVPAEEPRPHAEPEHAVATGGSLRAAYAEFVVDPDTHDCRAARCRVRPGAGRVGPARQRLCLSPARERDLHAD